VKEKRAWPACALERAREADVGDIAALEGVSFTHPWTSAQIREAVLAGDPIVVLVLRTPEPPGRGIVAYCIFQSAGGEMDLHTLTVTSGLQGRGLGRWMLARALEIGARRGAETAFLEVRPSNKAALGLYRSLGFEVVSTRAGYYERPREDAFVLRKTDLRHLPAGPPADP
jgi:ribosomal-protein-alanine N-acetyltransferase